MRLAAGQKDGKKTALSICDCVDFRIAPASRATNRLLLLPLFAPEAERCALMCVESIICISVARPRRQFAEQPLPNSAFRPAHKAIVDRLRWAIFRRAIAPAAAALHDMHDAADDPPIVNARLAAHVLRQIWLNQPHCSSLSQNRLDRIVSPRSESTSRANQQPIQTTTVLLGPHPSFTITLGAASLDNNKILFWYFLIHLVAFEIFWIKRLVSVVRFRVDLVILQNSDISSQKWKS